MWKLTVKPSAGTALFLVLVLEAAAANAQTTDARGANREADTQSVSLEQVVVTATKREQLVRDIPASITVFNGDQLQRENAQGIDDIARLTPGVTASGDGVLVKRVTIRGISADNLTSNTTGVFIGDVPFNDPFVPRVTLDPNPFDLASVEVLKGPQGTLFGGSGLNGAVRYVPNAPALNTWEARGFSEYTEFDHGAGAPSYGGVLNIPYGDAALRLDGFSRGQAGWTDDALRKLTDVNAIHQNGQRAALSWRPDGRWTLDVNYMRQETVTNDLPFVDNPQGNLVRYDTPGPSFVTTHYNVAWLDLGYQLDWADFKSLTAYNNKKFFTDSDISRVLGLGARTPPHPLAFSLIDNASHTWTEELRLVSRNSGPWQWVAGLFGYRYNVQEVSRFGLVTPRGPAPIQDADFGVHVDELAFYTEVTRRLSDRLDLTLGGRVYRTRSGGEVQVLLAAPPIAKSFDAALSEHGVNPKASLNLRITDDIKGYLTAARGFRFGGVNVSLPTPTFNPPQTYKSDKLWNYELGIRSEWFDKTLLFDTALFLIDWRDAQLEQRGSDGITTFIDNVGRVRSTGVELNLDYRTPLPGLTVRAGGSFQQTVTRTAFTTVDGKAIPSGSTWPLAPHNQMNAAVSYELPIKSWSITPTVQYSRIGPAWDKIQQTNRVFDYGTYDLQLGVHSNSIRFFPDLYIAATNLTDTRGLSFVNQTARYTDWTFIPPRSVMVRLEERF